MSAENEHNDAEENIDYSEIYANNQVSFESGFESCLIIDGLPISTLDKQEKMFKFLRKRFRDTAGVDVKSESCLHMPMDNGSSKGYLFAEFASAADANKVQRLSDNQAFDKKTVMRVNKFTDIQRFAALSDQMPEVQEPEFHEKEHLKSWLTDSAARDQLVTYINDDVSINWHSRAGVLETAHKRRACQNWTEFYVTWSPQGTYLASMHRQGVALWAGESWSKICRLSHPGVKLIDFSPLENYIVTWSNEPIKIPAGAPFGPMYFSEEDEGHQIAIWDIKTGYLLRTFPTTAASNDESGAPKKFVWPALKWSGDDKFVGRITPGVQISVYEAPEMTLSQKKSVKIDGVTNFEWCPLSEQDRESGKASKEAKKYVAPRENMFAFFTPEVSNQPARVSLMAFPSRVILRSKNLFNVADAQLHWQSNGDFLCVKVDRHTKTKKSIFCNLELFRVREKDYPVEVIEFKDNCLSFAWEPKGDRFAMVSSSDPSVMNPMAGQLPRTMVSFYQLDSRKGDFRLLKSMDSQRTSNALFWSPRGRQIVISTMGSQLKADLEFWDVDFYAEDRKEGNVFSGNKDDVGAGVTLMGSGEHYGVTNLEWDPSGRYIATSSSCWRHNAENGYALWDFRGTEMQRHLIDKFKQLSWRPRPTTLISRSEQKRIKRNLREEFSRAFDEEDAAAESNDSAELVAHRKRLIDEWNAWRSKNRKELLASKHSAKANAADKKEVTTQEIEEEVEEIIDEIVEVL